MERRVLISEWQKVTTADYNNFGLFPTISLDAVVNQLGIPDRGFWGFTVAQAAPAAVQVSGGTLYDNQGKRYYNDQDGGTTLDLLQLLPAVTRRVVAIVVWGTEGEAATQPRTFLTDATTKAVVGRQTATEVRRWANIGTVAGIEGPDPVAPAVASNYLTIGYVTLDPTGIITNGIIRATENVVPSLRSLANRFRELDIWRGQIGTTIETLATQITALANAQKGMAKVSMVLELAREQARIKDAMGLPDDYTAWGADHFLDNSESDTDHVDYLAKVEEGIRFPPAAIRDSQLGLLNPIDTKVRSIGNFFVPAYTEVTRVSNIGKDGELSISQYQHQTINTRKLTRSRIRVRWGCTKIICTNSSWWKSGRYDAVAGIFYRDGDVFQAIFDEGNKGNKPGHMWYRVTQYWEDKYEEEYWENIIVTEGLNGSVMAQTFLNSQDGYLVSIPLYFTRKATSGNVEVRLIRTTESASPDVNQVIASATVLAADIKLYPLRTSVPIPPTVVKKGERYAIMIVSAGAHFVATVNNNKFTQGSLFYSSDGAWFQGDLVNDLAFELVFAKFTSPRVEVQLQPLQLANGFTEIDINADVSLPDGTSLIWQVQVGSTWYDVKAYEGGNPLIGLPPLLNFRVVFVGTTDLMPGVGMLSNSRLLTSRPRSDFKHISEARTMPIGAPVSIVNVDVRLEGWRGVGHHVHTMQLLVGGAFTTVETPDVTADILVPEDPYAIIRRYTFNLAGPATAYKIRQSGTTDNVVAVYHVADRVDVAQAA